MDTTVPDIRFDENGVCHFCKIHNRLEEIHPLGEEGEKQFHQLIERIKQSGSEKEYDCIVGISGGRDSTYTLYMAVKMGLRPLAVHFDNGWNSDIAVSNIKNATEKLNVDLYTHVADWEEFKDLQKSFLKASVSDAEVPTDYVITSILYKVAADNKVKYILTGHSFKTEGIAPLYWTYLDGRYVRDIHKRFGQEKISSFPIMSMSELIVNTLFRRIKSVDFPDYIEYNHDEVDEILKKELNWRYYGGHHHESLYTVFFQSYYLPVKFNIDKRRSEYSALIRTNQLERNEALKKLEMPYPYDPEIIKYTISKLGFTEKEFNKIMVSENKSFFDYKSYYPIIRLFKAPIRIACKAHILPPVFYEKYLGDI
ncbi:N-acetyl sugar amidotransferase [Methanomicrobium sp. W14]|nr:N-acetyl sugar amidotransferase [Methanomicrobium sp. W14]